MTNLSKRSGTMDEVTPAPTGSGRYSTEHHKMRRLHGKASNYLCEGCCGRQARHWATIHGRTGFVPMVDRVPLCGVCHVAYDQSGHRVPHTEEARRKMSETRRGRPMPAETRVKLSAALTGRKMAPEHVEKAAAARRGQKRSPEARRRMSEAGKRRVARARESGASPLGGKAAENAAKTHCDNGHEFTPENTYDNHGNRGCLECKRATGRAWYYRNKRAG